MTMLCATCNQPAATLYADGLFSGRCERCANRTVMLLPERSITTLDTIHQMDALALLRALPAGFVDCIVTSPPYFGLRDYGVEGQIGLEPSPTEYIHRMMEVFNEVQRVLKPTGTCWVNLGDSYATNTHMNNGTGTGIVALKPGQNEAQRNLKQPKWDRPEKSLMMIPARFAIAMQDAGWILRSDIIWSKKAPMPESVTDRPTKSHEHIFMFTREPRYWSDFDAIREPVQETTISRYTHQWNGNQYRGYTDGPQNHMKKFMDNYVAKQAAVQRGANIRDVWHLSPEPSTEEHYAAYPTEIPRRCILSGCPRGGVVLDMFIGSGTTAFVARNLGRHYIGADLSPSYVAMARRRLSQTDPFRAREVAPGLIQRSLFSVEA